MSLFNLDPGLALWTWIVFGLLFVILVKFVFPPLLRTMKARENTITRSLDNAAQIETRLGEIETEYRDKMTAAGNEASEIIRRAREEAESVRAKILEKAEAEARTVMDQARNRSLEEKRLLLIALQDEIGDFVCDSAEKVIGRSFTGQDDREWVRDLARSL